MTNYHKALDFWKQNVAENSRLSVISDEKAILFAYHSCKIENDNITYYDTRDIFEHDSLSNYTGSIKTVIEIYNAKQAHKLFIGSFDKNLPFDEKLLKTMQLTLTQNTYDNSRLNKGELPGEYKRNGYVVGIDEIGASPENVSYEINELLDDINSVPDVKYENALKTAAFFHAVFENIHPFADGNGRTGRLAMNYILITHDHPPVIIHEEDRREYYAALNAWDRKQDLSPLAEFLKFQTEKTWKRQIERYYKV